LAILLLRSMFSSLLITSLDVSLQQFEEADQINAAAVSEKAATQDH
jgi:hypothetical protein